MIKALIIDLHGVLISKFPFDEYLKAVKEWLSKKGFEPGTYDRWRNGFGTLSSALDYQQGNLRKEYLKLMDNLPVYSEDCSDMAKLLKDSGFDLYLATDSSRFNAIQTLKTAGYPIEMFKMIVTGDDVQFAKPNTEMYEKIVMKIGYQDEEMTRTEYNPNDWLVIGDRITDITPAAKLGLKAFLTGKEGLREFLCWVIQK